MLFKRVVNDGSSFYAVTYAGALLRYRDNRRDGTNAPDGSTGWDPNSGSQIGIGRGQTLAPPSTGERKTESMQAPKFCS